MTGKRSSLLSLALLMVSVFFYLEAHGQPGWKTGVALLMLSGMCTIDFIQDKGKYWKLPYGAFALIFFVLSVKNFLAP